MNDVNNLNKTGNINVSSPSTQTISLSAITNKESTENSSININTVDGLSGVSDQQEANCPSIRINPTKRKLSSRRSIEDSDDIIQVNPNDYIEQQPKPKSMTIRDKAMSELDAAVNRKLSEYEEFISNAIESDKYNREMVESGLEEVDGEFQYMPDQLHIPMRDDEKINISVDDNEYEDIDDSEYVEPEPNIDVVYSDPFSDGIYREEDSITLEKDSDGYVEEIKDNRTLKSEAVEDEDIDEEIHENITHGSINVMTSVIQDDIIDSSVSTSDLDIDDEDFEDVTTSENNDEELSDDQILEISEAAEKHLKSEILQKIIKAGKTLDTSQFVVSNKVINVKEAFRNNESKVERTAAWPMTYAGRPFIASALKGPEIALLADENDSDSTGIGLTFAQAKIIFEHDSNPYKPATLEAWSKTIPFADIENIFAALYVASLKGSNYIPMSCIKNSCQYMYLSDDIDINTMLKFKNDEAKQRFEKIKSINLTQENTNKYESVVSVINDKFAVGLKIPSIFTILYEYGSLNREFIKKYSTVVSIIQYIDYIYLIDSDSSEFKPIGWKPYHGDNSKTFKSKISAYSKILREFDDTDFSVLIALINSMLSKASEMKGISYEVPATKCPKCGADIEAREISPRGLVFMRQRLVELATTPTEK